MLSISQNCTITPTKEVTPDDSPIFIASFPGSGARMSWKLVEGLTGKPTGDEWDSNELGKNVVAVKTHWPHPTHGHKLDWADEIERVLVLMRNPLAAIPEFHNFIYSYTLEGNDELEVKIAPKDLWMQWRDSNFNQQLFLWRSSLQYWLEKYSAKDRLVIPFERLTNELDGVGFTEELNLFLQGGKNHSTTDTTEDTDPELAACVWWKAVQSEHGQQEDMAPLKAKNRKLFRTNPANDRPFTKEQYNQMIVIVRNLRIKFFEEKRLDNVFKMYDVEIKKARDAQKYNDLFMQFSKKDI